MFRHSFLLFDKTKKNAFSKLLRIDNYTLPTFNIPTSSGKGFDGFLRKQLSKIILFKQSRRVNFCGSKRKRNNK